MSALVTTNRSTAARQSRTCDSRPGDDRDRDRGALPLVVMVDFGDRNVEAVTQAVDDRTDRGALRLQRTTLRDMQIETGGGGVHPCILAPLRGTASIRNRAGPQPSHA